MFVSDWMTTKVFTVEPGQNIADALKVLKEKGIKHVPVVKGAKLKGIISDRDIREYVPSKATALDMYELHYLLQKTRVKDIMKTDVITTTPDTPIEEASMVLHDKNIGCLPVLEGGKLVGIISDWDIFEVLVDITGVRHGGVRVALTVSDRPGSIKEVADIIRKYGLHLQGVLTSYEGVNKGFRRAVIRATGKGDLKSLEAELQGTFKEVHIKRS